MTDKKNNEEQYEFESFQIFALLFKNKWFISGVTFLGIVVSVVISLMLPNWYLATTNVVPPSQDDTGLGSAISGISSALREFGLSKLGGSGGGEAYSFIVILQSRSVVDSMISKYNLAEVYDIPDTNITEIRKEFLGNSEVMYEKEGNYTVSIWDTNPERAAKMANDYVEIANHFAVKLAREEAKMNSQYLEQRIASIDSSISGLTSKLEEFSKKYMVFSFEEQAKAYANSYSEIKAQEMQYDILYEYYKNIYGENDSQTKDFLNLKNSLSKKLYSAENEDGITGDFSLRDAGEIGIEYMKTYLELETYAKVKAFLMPSLEDARIKEIKNTKNLYVLDEAVTPDKKDKPKRSIIVAGSALGSFAFAVLLILIVNSYRRFKERYNRLVATK